MLASASRDTVEHGRVSGAGDSHVESSQEAEGPGVLIRLSLTRSLEILFS